MNTLIEPGLEQLEILFTVLMHLAIQALLNLASLQAAAETN